MYLPKFSLTLVTAAVLSGLLSACQPAAEAQSSEAVVAAAEQQSGVQPVLDLFERVTGSQPTNVHLVLVQDSQPDWYQVEAKDGQLYVSANALTALSYGTYEYLRQTGALSVSWEGSRVALPAQFADYPAERVTSLFAQRSYLNVCAYGYSSPWWGWDRWQEELDWMALHGVNNPVAMEGQEYIWQQL